MFVAVDHCSGECVGNHAARSGNRFEALEPVRQGVLRHFGRIEKDAAKGLALRHDHGSNYLSGDFQDEIVFLGIESSPSFVRQPEANGVAERFIRTLKENFLWVHTFDTIEELRRGLQVFVAHSTPPGSSPGTATAPRTRSAPSNAALLNAHRPTYPWPPE